MKAKHSLYLCAAMLSGCATSANFSKALEEPVKTANAAKLVVEQAQRDAQKARLMGWMSDARRSDQGWAPLVCTPSKSMDVTLQSLASFGEALKLIKEVAETPSDTSYAGYVEQYRKNQDNLADAKAKTDDQVAQKAWQDAVEAEALARTRCITLYQSDAASANRIDPKALGYQSLGFLPALSSLMKGLLAIRESAQREAAVRATAAALVPSLRISYKQLNGAPAANGPYIAYDGQKYPDAYKMGETQLGAAVNLRRWFVARQIEQSIDRVQTCRGSEKCLGDPLMRMSLDSLVDDIASYRELAAIKPDDVLKALNLGIVDAETAVKNPAGSWAQMLDALLAAVDAIDGLNTQYAGVKASRE